MLILVQGLHCTYSIVEPWAIMHRVRSSEIEVHYHNITAFLCCFLLDTSLTSDRNQVQIAPANMDGGGVGANCSDAQEPFKFDL